MKARSIKAGLWRLILIPALAITLLLAGTLTYLYASELAGFMKERGRVLAEKSSHLTAIALRENNEALLQELIAALREEPDVRALHIYDSTKDVHHHSGPQFLPATHQNSLTPGKVEITDTDKTTRFSSPILDNRNQQPLGTIEIEIQAAPFWVTLYKTLLIALLATTACLLLASYLAIKLHASILAPITHLKKVTEKLTNGQFGSRAETDLPFELAQLSTALNTMAISLEHLQADMRGNINQSMDDLRETMETIEIQNIELDIARKEALAASRIKSEFLANTSHEIRTPLNGIIGFTNLALKTSLDNQQRGYLQTIQDSATNLLKIINDILDFSKIESGKLVLDYLSFPIRNTLEEAVESLAYNAQEKNIQIATIIDNNIPPQLMGDSQRLKQVVANLLDNAIKFSARGSVALYADLTEFEENHVLLKISVQDEGIGLDEDIQKQLFSSFTQADASASREHSGTGLGLAICKGLVQRMGGDIGVDSSPERGARFWFTLRLGIDSNYTALDNNYLRDRRVLICSEHHINYLQLQSLMESWEGETFWVSSVHELFPTMRREAKANRPCDLLVLDISPDERKLPPGLLSNIATQLDSEFHCKVLIWCTAAHKHLFEQHNADHPLHFINKPITHDALLEAVRKLFGLRGSEHRLDRKKRSIPGENILVVDDNPANLRLASELLKELNLNVSQAISGKEAIEKFSEARFEAVFMDIQMPGMDGMETTARLRKIDDERQQRTPIIALTAHSLTEQKTELLLSGFDDCLRKPVNESQLSHVLKRWTNITNRPSIQSIPQAESNSIQGYGFSPVSISQCLSLAHNKPDLARDMLLMLISTLPGDKEKIQQAYAEKNWAAMQEHTHRLYGSSCYCGVPELRSLAGLLDKILQSDQKSHISNTWKSLAKAMDKVLFWAEERDIPALFPEAKTPVPSMPIS